MGWVDAAMNSSANRQEIETLTRRLNAVEAQLLTLAAQVDGPRLRADRLAEKRELSLARLVPQRDASLLRHILHDVAQFLDLSEAAICGPSHKRNLFEARAAICYTAASLYGTQSTVIGRVLGDRDHSTILSAASRGAQLYRESPPFKALVDHLSACDAQRKNL
jgi:chromosomal replication initiation ATPase DnaA